MENECLLAHTVYDSEHIKRIHWQIYLLNTSQASQLMKKKGNADMEVRRHEGKKKIQLIH